MDWPERRRIPPYLAGGADPSQRRDSAPAGSAPGDPLAQKPRPFILTSGRVPQPDPDLGLETQITAARKLPPRAAPVSALPPEQQAILAQCSEPVSVAEISARLPLHLGVTKVLVSDLRATGHLDVHAQDAPDPHDPDIILRVIRGLRAIA